MLYAGGFYVAFWLTLINVEANVSVKSRSFPHRKRFSWCYNAFNLCQGPQSPESFHPAEQGHMRWKYISGARFFKNISYWILMWHFSRKKRKRTLVANLEKGSNTTTQDLDHCPILGNKLSIEETVCTSEGQVFHQREAASLNPTGKGRAKAMSPSCFPTASPRRTVLTSC